MTEYRGCEKGNLQAVVSMFHYSNRSELDESFLYFQKFLGSNILNTSHFSGPSIVYKNIYASVSLNNIINKFIYL